VETLNPKNPKQPCLKRIDVVTLFPQIVEALHYGVTGRALQRGIVALNTWNPRDYAIDNYHTVDDRPYGGGPGMVMLAPPLQRAIGAAKADQASGSTTNSHVIYLSPAGKPLTQADIGFLAENYSSLILVAGRYEGVDQRLIDQSVDEIYSIGDYVLSGGEIPSLVMVDSLIRLLPGVLGSDESAKQDSFSDGLLDCPHYTRPECYNGERVPDVLLSGNHQAIRRWRLKQSLGRTACIRPDLLKKRVLSTDEQSLLGEFLNESQ